MSPPFPCFQKMKLKASLIFIPSLMHTYFSNHSDWMELWKQTVNCDTGSVRGFSGSAWAERRPVQTCQTSAWRRKFRQNLCYGSREKKEKKKAKIFDFNWLVLHASPATLLLSHNMQALLSWHTPAPSSVLHYYTKLWCIVIPHPISWNKIIIKKNIAWSNKCVSTQKTWCSCS